MKVHVAAFFCLLMSPLTINTSYAGSVFHDDFADMDIRDNRPVRWDFGDASTGDLVLSGNEGLSYVTNRGLLAEFPNGMSLRTRVHLESHGRVAMGLAGKYVLLKKENGPVVSIGILEGSENHAIADLPIDYIGRDVIMQFDGFDNSYKAWIWPVDDISLISSIEISRNDTHFSPWIWSNTRATFRYVHGANEHIPLDIRLPVLGDIDGDFDTDASDIDVLSAAILENSLPNWTHDLYDVNNDGQVDTLDRSGWVHDIQTTYFGDSNLDGEFNSGDLTSVFQAGEYEDGIANNSTWATGDWDGNTEFDSGDLVLAFQDGGYERGPREAIIAVPEPADWISLLWPLAIVFILDRKHMQAR